MKFNRNKSKKSQAKIITTFLIILLVLGAVVIIFNVVNKTLESKGESVDKDFRSFVSEIFDSGESDVLDNLVFEETGCSNEVDSENLVLNGDIELDLDDNGVPDNWIKSAQDDANHILSWVDNPYGESKILMNEYDGLTTGTSFGWQQNIYNLEPDTWYEYEARFATEGLTPTIQSDNTIRPSTTWVGLVIYMYNDAGVYMEDYSKYFWSTGVELTDWDEDSWVYRTYNVRGLEDWKTIKTYIKTPQNIEHIRIKTYSATEVKIYADDFSLKKVVENCDPSDSKKLTGTIEFIQYKGADFFPLIFRSWPQIGGIEVDMTEMKARGFNGGGIRNYQGLSIEQSKQLMIDNDLAGYRQIPNIPSNDWENDPTHVVSYPWIQTAKDRIDDNVDFENLIFFSGPDEVTCKPDGRGVYFPELRTYERLYSYMKQENLNANIYYNYCGYDSPYTGMEKDLLDYFQYSDFASYTNNIGPAYPEGDSIPKLGRSGKIVRKGVQLSLVEESYTPHIAYGFGTLSWSNWDRQGGGLYIPYNLQEFLIFDQIINGAVGVWFYLPTSMNLDNIYQNHIFEQVSMIAGKLSGIYDVLLEPEFFDEWSVSDDRIEVLMKKHNGKIYLLTANTHYEDLYDITINLDGVGEITSVTSLNDVINGDIFNPIDRDDSDITINPDRISFTDDFIGEDDTAIQGKEAPGYTVHVYEIEYSEVVLPTLSFLFNYY